MERTHAGPSAPTPPRIPSVRPFTKQPSRRDSKKTAGAANDQKSTGENKVSVSNVYRSDIPRATIDHSASEGSPRSWKTAQIPHPDASRQNQAHLMGTEAKGRPETLEL